MMKRPALLLASLLCAGTLSPLTSAAELTTQSAYRYDRDYPVIGYNEAPTQNVIARLQARLDRGELRLKYQPGRGYLDSLLRALDIDPSSQLLVFSKTSLQAHAISGSRPRAIYFNDSAYVAWVQGVNLLEFTVMDDVKGAVYYTLDNRPDGAVRLEHETGRCLTCHDTFSMSGGGVPRFLAHSVHADVGGEVLDDFSINVNDETPMRDRWGGWYVTGQQGSELHLGNIQARSAADFRSVEKLRLGNLESLEGLFDTRPYPTPQSDIVALLVFEHQAQVQNLITRANFKGRTLLAQASPGDGIDGDSWESLPPAMQARFKGLLEPLVQTLVFAHAAPFADRITCGSGFDTWFERQGPRDASGRSLRDMDLGTRLFRYPLSYMVYTRAFDALPGSAKQFVYARLAEILGVSRDPDRKAALEILSATKPDFRQNDSRTPSVK